MFGFVKKTYCLIVFFFLLSVSADITINEFMAENYSAITDIDGDASDWIELYNDTSSSVNLDGFYLTDDKDELTKWQFPAVTISSNSYLLVFASGKNLINSASQLHTNFSLTATGEYLALVAADGTTVLSDFGKEFPPQRVDVSFGKSGINEQYFTTPTPGAANSPTTFSAIVEKPGFSQEHGFYEGSFPLTISTETPSATIRYTLNGSEPTEISGTIYTEPLQITTTTVIRAKAFKQGCLESDLATSTYIYVDDVARQPASIQGWPDSWGLGQDRYTYNRPADYEMDPQVVNNTIPGYSIREALLDIPTVAITMEQDDFIKPDYGIYAYISGEDSNASLRVERKCTFEYILPEGGNTPTVDCKIEKQGNWSRRPWVTQKYSMRVTFTGEFGPTKLKYPFFSESNVDEYNQLILRNSAADGWSLVSWISSFPPHGTLYMRDKWMKDSFREMGHDSPYGRYTHVYVNGVYFGVHNLTERLNNVYYSDHLGGEPEDWEVNADFGSEGVRWQAMEAIDASTSAGYAQIQEYLDVENFADYMMIHFYGDCRDWPSHNGFAAANIGSGDGKFRFTVWDQESSFRQTRSGTKIDLTSGSIPQLFINLRQNEEFRLMFADRFHKHCFNGGALSEAETQNRYLSIASTLDKAIVAESARWGDVAASTPYGTAVSTGSLDPSNAYYPPPLPIPDEPDKYYFTRENSWLLALESLVNTYIPALYDENHSYSIVDLFRRNNLYPSIDAPVFNINGSYQHGGYAVNEDLFTISNPNSSGDVYYTVDGSDPRLAGGELNPSAKLLEAPTSGEVTFAGFSDEWKYLYNGSDQGTSWRSLSFDDSSWGTASGHMGFGDGDETTNIGPKVTGQMSAYFRRKFFIDNVDDVQTLSFNLTYDDGAVVYLNGTELNRYDMPAGDILFDTSATAAGGDAKKGLMSNIDTSLLKTGENIVAVEVHQYGAISSDLSFEFELSATVSSPQVDSSSVKITETTKIKSRILSNGEWSALTEANYEVGNVKEKLRISEIMYHPSDSTELSPGSEFIELQNVSDEPINLNLVSFSNGVHFTFPNIQLPAGEFVVVVENEAVFRAQYPDFSGVIAGEYTGVLADSGERLTLVDAVGTEIHSFKYDSDWFVSTNGGGFSLNVRDLLNTDPTLWGEKSTWGYSTYKLGTPGEADSGPKVGDVVISEISPFSQQFIEIYNRSENAINISNWSIEGVNFSFPEDSVINSEEAVVIAANSSSLTGDFQTWQWESGELLDTGELLKLLDSNQNILDEVHYFSDSSWPNIDSSATLELKKSSLNNASASSWRQSWYIGGSPGIKNSLKNPIVLTEIYYNASALQGADDDYEFLELYNRGDFRMDVSNYQFVEGVTYTFPTDSFIDPGEYIVMASNSATYTGNGYQVFQWTSGSLSNKGETVRLEDADTFKVFDVEYDNKSPWPLLADGGGSSIALKDVNLKDLDDITSWTDSGIGNTTPGAANIILARPTILINEILAHTDYPQVDFIELYNPTPNDANIGGWWLTDDLTNLENYQIPANTIVPAGGFIVIYEEDGNGNCSDAQFFGSKFSLSSHGEEVYLLSPTHDYHHGFEFPASENGVSFGRYVNSVGDELFPVLSTLTENTTNSTPFVSNVLISEIMYNPSIDGVEFVEILNSSENPVKLFHSDYPEHSWKVDGIDFSFPANVTLDAGEAVLLIPITANIDNFRLDNNLPENIKIYQYLGALNNSGERLTLLKPDKPDELNGEVYVPYLTVDSVKYGSTSPWPTEADGNGSSLVRKYPIEFADDLKAWQLGCLNGSPGLTDIVELKVIDGTGSGFYFVGAQVQVSANAPDNATFHHWSGDVIDSSLSTTSVNLEENVTISALFYPEISWPQPKNILYGTSLSELQKNASCQIAGAPISYIFPPEEVLPVGTHMLQANFTPDDLTTFVPAQKIVNITVDKKTLSYRAKNYAIREGDFLPQFDFFAPTGLANNEDIEQVVSGFPELSTIATADSPVGTYPISISIGDLNSQNYSFNFIDGSLLIYEKERPQSVKIELKIGWNLISQPYKNLAITDCFGENALTGDLFSWQNGYVVNKPDEIMEPELGYWVFSLSEQTAIFSGEHPPRKETPISNTGWNLIGTLVPINKNEITLQLMWSWDAEKQVYEASELLEPGKAYWIYKKE